MILELKELPPTIAGPNDNTYKGRVPGRARFLHPEATDSILQIEADTGGLVYTDVYRSAEASLAAMAVKSGVQPPGYSAHGFGFAVDLDVTSVLKKLSIKYPDLLNLMASYGWFCHRRDGLKDEMEYWHFNYLGEDKDEFLAKADPKLRKTWSLPVEYKIHKYYGAQFQLDSAEIQENLKRLRLYNGEVDGLLGPLSKQAVAAFQRTWKLAATGVADDRTKRVLAFVAAEKNIIKFGNNS